MSVSSAHIAGPAIEETVASSAPAAVVARILVRARIRELGPWRRRR